MEIQNCASAWRGGYGTVYKVEQVSKPGYFQAVKEALVPIHPQMNSNLPNRALIEIDLLFNLSAPYPFDDFSFQERE
jgi:hypothetical protein